MKSSDASKNAQLFSKAQEKMQKDERHGNTLAERLKHVIQAKTQERGRFAKLEGMTDIAQATWRTWWTRGQSPNGLLLEAIARLWPEHAYWLITGMTDTRCGHTKPLDREMLFSIWPEKENETSEVLDDSYGKTYLRYCIELANFEDRERRLNIDVMLHSLPYLCEQRFEEIHKRFINKNEPTWVGTISKGD